MRCPDIGMLGYPCIGKTTLSTRDYNAIIAIATIKLHQSALRHTQSCHSDANPCLTRYLGKTCFVNMTKSKKKQQIVLNLKK